MSSSSTGSLFSNFLRYHLTDCIKQQIFIWLSLQNDCYSSSFYKSWTSQYFSIHWIYNTFYTYGSPIPINSIDGQHSIASDIRVPVFQTLSNCRHQRLQQLGLFQFTQEAQGGSSDKFIGVLQILQTMAEKILY